MEKRSLEEMQAAALPRLVWTDLFAFDGEAPLTAEQEAGLNQYLATFIPWQTDADGNTVCVCCGSQMQGGLMGVLLDGAPHCATLRWGLVHGEAHCSRCGYPARVYHFNVGGEGEAAIIKRMEYGLQYHPDSVHRTKP